MAAAVDTESGHFFDAVCFRLEQPRRCAVRFFWGLQWTSPLVLVLLAFFAAGVVLGVLGMVPRWWRQKRLAQKAAPASAPPATSATPSTPTAADIPYGP